MFEKPLFIRAEWDEDVNVWVATSDDVPGLATEGDTLEILIQKLKVLIPELLFANGAVGGLDVPFEVLARSFEIARGVNL
jgi:ABC-type phosphonate transport system ATPase subunit